MADSNSIELEFRIITDNTSDTTKTPEDFNDYLEDTIQTLELNSDNYVAYVVDNMNDTSSANRALLLRYNGGDTQIFYNSTDNYLKSRSKSDLSTASDNGLMSSHDYALLRNLDENLNIEDTSALVENNNEILTDIIEVDEDKTVTNTNKIYKFKENKISTIDDINERLDTDEENIENIMDFLDEDLVSSYANLKEYIDSLIASSVDTIISDYINHTHSNS
jgi:hypothetical protein